MIKILFVSAIDFKEKSIQVIAKTPEAYVRHGWQVHYVVARDSARSGDYYYEREFNPDMVEVERVYWPFAGLRTTRGGKLSAQVNKLASWVAVLRLSHAVRTRLRAETYDIVYGYEVHGVLAARLAMIGLKRRPKFVTRFQGTFLGQIAERGDRVGIIGKWDHVIALRSQSDLTIMTNDGTQGDRALEIFRKPFEPQNIRFWVNGVDKNVFVHSARRWPPNPVQFLTISRLVSWKRVDRAIRVFHAFSKRSGMPCTLKVVGEGLQRKELENLVVQLGLGAQVEFVGGLEHKEAMARLAETDFFLSTYDGSNVGNPLLEAIRAHALILTLANGDTDRWIKHMKNGLIYDPEEDFIPLAARDLISVVTNRDLYRTLCDGVRKTEVERLWTWSERLDAEVSAVSQVLEDGR